MPEARCSMADSRYLVHFARRGCQRRQRSPNPVHFEASSIKHLEPSIMCAVCAHATPFDSTLHSTGTSAGTADASAQRTGTVTHRGRMRRGRMP